MKTKKVRLGSLLKGERSSERKREVEALPPGPRPKVLAV
jgi:hypothetical protein